VDRRAFIAGTLALLAAPFGAGAQPSAVPRIGLLADATSWEPLRLGLRDLGYVEGKSITLEERSSQGRHEGFRELALELVRLNVSVIVTSGTPATLAAKQATTTIPIVMASAGDPVRSGLVSSLAHPGGNVTGLTILGPGLAAKRLELLKEAVPTMSRVAFLGTRRILTSDFPSRRSRSRREPWAQGCTPSRREIVRSWSKPSPP
jgi:putative tryptophan/tyrosine transport system substrate-binding protein